MDLDRALSNCPVFHLLGADSLNMPEATVGGEVNRLIDRISQNVEQLTRLCGLIGGPQDSHDLRSRL